MQRIFLGLGALALSSTSAMAGGLDRSGQNITSIFETGNYAELSFGYVTPDVTGNFAGLFESGNVGPAYSQLSFAVKTDLNPKISIGLIVDQPYGAEVNYADVGYVLGMIDKHASHLVAPPPQETRITYRRASGSTVELSPTHLWDKDEE